MVQKFCPNCTDWIPVACKTCPCGHKFVKPGAESAKKDADKTENEPPLGRQENGRPRRRSAMNSLYYHSSLQLSSYKLTKHAVTTVTGTNARRKSSTDDNDAMSNGASVNGASDLIPHTNGRAPIKRKRGRPRLTPRLESEEVDDSKVEQEPEPKPEIIDDPIPVLRKRRPGLMSPNLRRTTGDMYEHSNLNDPESKTSKTRAISESESYSKLYQTLSDTRKKHFAYILDDINFKFKRNANFPL